MPEYVIDLTGVEVKTIKDAHSIEAIEALWGLPVREEVVRCRDCKHILRYHGVDPETGLPIGAEDWRCNHFKNREGPLEISPNGFCAWGERRADG